MYTTVKFKYLKTALKNSELKSQYGHNMSTSVRWF